MTARQSGDEVDPVQRIHNVPRFAILLLASVMLMSGGGGASAQVDNRVLFERMDRLERDIQVLNQNVARGSSTGSTVIRSPAVEAPALPPAMAARLDVRVDMLEEQIRQLTGKVEEANFRAMQALKDIERMQADIDLRFKDLQDGTGTGSAGEAPSGAPAALTAPGPAPAKIGANSAEAPGGAPGPQILGTMPEKDMKKALAEKPPAPRDAQSLYDDAYASAQRGDYVNAAVGFKAFLDGHPDHQLAGNASYWLGDIAYVKKDFSTAAGSFLEAYKKYPKHTKAPDMIFKAGAAFGQLGKKKEACMALGILFKEHPNMPDRVKRAATAERQRNECK